MHCEPKSGLRVNGFLVLTDLPGYENDGYEGVYGIHWPLEDLGIDTDRRALGLVLAPDTMEVATLWSAARQYYADCLAADLPVRVLMVQTDYDYPVVTAPVAGDWQLVGYDVAAVLGDFYSALQQEVLSATPSSLGAWRSLLNSHGLFDTIDTASDFLIARSELLYSNPAIESCGEMKPVKLHKLRRL